MAAGLLVAAVSVLGAVGAATRLDRLQVRTDAAWAALDATLCRRARAGSALDGGPLAGWALRCAADAALRARSHSALLARAPAVRGAGAHAAREEAENELGRALAALDRAQLRPACAARLADAEQRLVIARRVYNDAVRDTLALRSHRMVRWLRLAGTAPLPRYCAIAEPASPSYGLELAGAGA